MMKTNNQAESLYHLAIQFATSRGLFAEDPNENAADLVIDAGWEDENSQDKGMQPDLGTIIVLFIAAITACACCLCLMTV